MGNIYFSSRFSAWKLLNSSNRPIHKATDFLGSKTGLFLVCTCHIYRLLHASTDFVGSQTHISQHVHGSNNLLCFCCRVMTKTTEIPMKECAAYGHVNQSGERSEETSLYAVPRWSHDALSSHYSYMYMHSQIVDWQTCQYDNGSCTKPYYYATWYLRVVMITSSFTSVRLQG